MGSNVLDIDQGFKKFFKDLKVFNDVEGEVGVPEDLGGQLVNGSFTRLDQAIAHEFGVPKDVGSRIPSRSYLRFTFDKHQEKYKKAFEKAAENVIKKGAKPFAEMFKLAEQVRSDVLNSINNREIRQELSQATIDRKGSSTALLDTGGLVGSIQARVKKK